MEWKNLFCSQLQNESRGMNMFSPACHSIHTGLNNEVDFVSPWLPAAVNHINLDRRRNLL